MPDAPKLRTLPVVIYEQTEAQWAVDGRVFDVNVVLVPTDGSNKGKHKLADGIRTYAELSFVENTSSGGDPAPFIYVTAGDDATGIYRYQFMNEGKRCYVLLGVTATPENLFNCVVWADLGTGLQWNVTDEIGEVLYTSASDVATPDLATGWTLDQGTGPLPSIAGYPGPTVQDVLEQLAAKVPNEKVWEGYITQSGTSAPTVVDLTNTIGGSPVLSYESGGTYYATLANAFPEVKTSSFLGILQIHAIKNGTGFIEIARATDSILQFRSGPWNDAPADDLLSSTYFRISVKR
jgi:hypothetical protein